ncbi:MAG: glycine cleavage system protein H [Anaerolineae bacterium]
MAETLSLTVDKFTFQVPTDRDYTDEGVWALLEGDGVRIGVTDYLQQSGGDIAFAEVKPVGTAVRQWQEVASIETIKVNLALGAPAAGVVAQVNPALADTPEIINADPYGAGWLAVLTPAQWAADRARLLDSAAYFAHMKAQAEQQRRTP